MNLCFHIKNILSYPVDLIFNPRRGKLNLSEGWKILSACLMMTFFLPLSESVAQEFSNISSYEKISVSYNVGGQVYNDNFIYSPGFSFHVSHGFKLNEDVGIGLGIGLISLTNERFLPVFVEFIGQKKKQRNTPFILFQGGYSIGWNLSSPAIDSYDMDGGLYFNAGLGRRININEKYSLLFNWSYCHQFAKMEYVVFGDSNYSEVLNYDMILISISLVFN